MSHKMVKPDVVKALSNGDDWIPIGIAIDMLRKNGYDASERAFADVGYPPKMIKIDGHWQSVVLFQEAA